MKFAAHLAAVVVAVLSSAASVQVTGAQETPTPADVVVKIATKDLLNNPTALVNKNTVATDNNVFIARSNLLFSQTDRIGVMRSIEDFVEQADPSSMSTAVLSKSILKAISAPDTDAAMMSKASAVVAAKGNPAALQRSIADLLMAKEQLSKAQTPLGVTLLMDTKDVLRQPATSENNQKMPTSEDKYRTGFLYTKAGENDDKEQFGLWGDGLGFGWRYPLGYWNLYGRGFYDGGCGLGLGFGGFFYC